MTVEVSKLTGAAVLKPATDSAYVTKVAAYAVMKPAASGVVPIQSVVVVVQ